MADRLPGLPAGDYFTGTTLTLDGARDNCMGPCPPARWPTPRAARWRRPAVRAALPTPPIGVSAPEPAPLELEQPLGVHAGVM